MAHRYFLSDFSSFSWRCFSASFHILYPRRILLSHLLLKWTIMPANSLLPLLLFTPVTLPPSATVQSLPSQPKVLFIFTSPWAKTPPRKFLTSSCASCGLRERLLLSYVIIFLIFCQWIALFTIFWRFLGSSRIPVGSLKCPLPPLSGVNFSCRGYARRSSTCLLFHQKY